MNQNKKIAEKKSRPYQQECIDKVDSLKEGRFLIALAIIILMTERKIRRY